MHVFVESDIEYWDKCSNIERSTELEKKKEFSRLGQSEDLRGWNQEHRRPQHPCYVIQLSSYPSAAFFLLEPRLPAHDRNVSAGSSWIVQEQTSTQRELYLLTWDCKMKSQRRMLVGLASCHVSTPREHCGRGIMIYDPPQCSEGYCSLSLPRSYITQCSVIISSPARRLHWAGDSLRVATVPGHVWRYSCLDMNAWCLLNE